MNLFSDFEKYLNISDEWEAPRPAPYKDQGNLRSWLQEADGCDQFAVIHKGGEEVS